VLGEIQNGECVLCNKKDDWSHILRCEEIRKLEGGPVRQKIHKY
jgi:hypothetical protein